MVTVVLSDVSDDGFVLAMAMATKVKSQTSLITPLHNTNYNFDYLIRSIM